MQRPFGQPVSDLLRRFDVQIPRRYQVAATDELLGHGGAHTGARTSDDDPAATGRRSCEAALAGPSISGFALNPGSTMWPESTGSATPVTREAESSSQTTAR